LSNFTTCNDSQRKGAFMPLLYYVKLYLLTIPVFFLFDIIWLGWLGRGFYESQIGFILGDRVN